MLERPIFTISAIFVWNIYGKNASLYKIKRIYQEGENNYENYYVGCARSW